MEKYTAARIKELLAQLGISFETNSIELPDLNFKSLRKIEPHGIYFSEGFSRGDIERSLVLCSDFDGFDSSNCLIKVSHPQLAFYKLMRLIYSDNRESYRIHSTAVIHPEAIISPQVHIGPYCVIGKCEIHTGAKLTSHVVVTDGCVIGENTVIESHSTIGASGVAWIWDDETKERVIQPQIGGVVVGKNCFLGSDVSVVRGSINENTQIGDGTVVAHGTKLGHGCLIGPYNHFANNVSLAGNVTTGDRCFFGAASVVRPMITLCADTTVGAGAVVVHSVSEPHLVLMGVPARNTKPEKDKLSGVPKKFKGVE